MFVPSTVSIDDVTVVEGDAGTTEAVFTVARSSPSGSADLARLALASAAPAQESLAVAYASAGGTAGPGTVVRVGPRPS